MTARQKIFTHLEKNKLASAQDLSRALKMSPETIRHHLRLLIADGRVLRVPASGSRTRGRPAQVYASARAASADNFAALASALLDEARPKVHVEALAERIWGAQGETINVLSVRLAAAVEKLNQMEYQARWEAGSDGPRIILGHCPYAKIITAHPVLCAMDEAILAKGLGRAMKQTAKLEPDLKGIRRCVFASR